MIPDVYLFLFFLFEVDNGDYSTPYEDIRKPPPLTQADLEEYARSYDDVLKPLHQHQGSYAQSEGELKNQKPLEELIREYHYYYYHHHHLGHRIKKKISIESRSRTPDLTVIKLIFNAFTHVHIIRARYKFEYNNPGVK